MLGGFQDYLVRKAALNSKYIPYYTRWVSSCYSFLDQPDNSLLTSEHVQCYLNYISMTCEDWQVKQAETALRFYSHYLASHDRQSESVNLRGVCRDEPLWTALEKNTRDALRLRHRSYSTEKTYLGWLRAFRGFVAKDNPSELSVSDMQNFSQATAGHGQKALSDRTILRDDFFW